MLSIAASATHAHASSGNEIAIDVDNTAAGGDGVAGQVIGSHSSGNLVVIAISDADHVTATGGDARTTNKLDIGDPLGSPVDVDRSADSASGDGVNMQVSGAVTHQGPVDAPGSALGLSFGDDAGLPVVFELTP